MAPKKQRIQESSVSLPPGRVQVSDREASSSQASALPPPPPADVTGPEAPPKKKLRRANMLRARRHNQANALSFYKSPPDWFSEPQADFQVVKRFFSIASEEGCVGSTDIFVFNDVQHYLCMETRCKLRSTSKTSNSPCEGLALAPTASADSCRHAQTRGHVQGSSLLWCHAGGRAGKRSCKKKWGRKD